MKVLRRPYVLLGLVVIFGGSLMAGCSFRSGNQEKEASESGSELIRLDGDQVVTLALDNRVGKVHVRSGASGEIRVEYTKTAYAETEAKAQEELRQLEIKIEQESDRVRVYTTDSARQGKGQSNKVNFEITVPDTINLILNQDVGDIRVEDVQAPDALRVTLKVGEITLDDVSAPDRLRLRSETGAIVFTGELAGDGNVSTKVGAVRLELSPDTVIRIDARTKVGKVTVSDFDVRNVQDEREIVSERWRGTLGQGESSAVLTVQTDTGDISIERS